MVCHAFLTAGAVLAFKFATLVYYAPYSIMWFYMTGAAFETSPAMVREDVS